MKNGKLRIVIPLLVMAVIGVGFVLNTGVGTLSAIGWGDVSLLCPLGALATMIASKTIVPKAVASLAIAIVAIVLLGRAFCAWICPVPVVSKLRDAFGRRNAHPSKVADGAVDHASEVERAHLGGCSSGCASCGGGKPKADSRHFILGGSLLSAAIFGFPVFCLICPIGLTFATILLVILLFGNGDVTWSVVLVPLLLVVEVVFFRKWCSKICPLSALMSLVGKANRTFRPSVDNSKCLETSKGASCGVCASVCDESIDPRHPERGVSWSECTKCRKCVDACPANAISMPLLPKVGSVSDVQLDEVSG